MLNFFIDIDVTALFILVAFGLAFIISLLLTPLSKKIAFKLNVIALPNERSMHKVPMPMAGGIAIVGGFCLTMIILSQLSPVLSLKSIQSLLIGGVMVSILGFLDDKYSLSPKMRVLIQILAASLVVLSGLTIDHIQIPFIGTYIRFGVFSAPLTIFWIVGITNAMNLMDGLDGLAAGIASIAAISLMFISILNAEPVAILLTASLAGACLGFLPHNFNPAKIFMGDTGSTFLGFTLSVISIQGLIKSYTAAIVIAVLVLGLPIFDTAFAIIRRVLAGKPISQADKGHLHHRLIDRGYSQKKAVLTLYGVSGCFGIIGILFAETEFTLAIIVLIIMIAVVLRGSLKYKKEK